MPAFLRVFAVATMAGAMITICANEAHAQCQFQVEYRTITSFITYGFDSTFPSNRSGLIDAAVGEWTTYIADTRVAVNPAQPGQTPDIIVKTADLPSTTAGESVMWTDGSGAAQGTITVNSDLTTWTDDFLKHHLLHEFGHQMGFGHSPCDATQSVMAAGATTNDPAALHTLPPSDRAVMATTYPWVDPNCNPTECSPVTLDLDYTGTFNFTAPDVWFDLRGAGTTQLFGWTAAGTLDGYLALDRNGNGSIDNGRELFGNATPYSFSLDGPAARNGFDALRWLDKPGQGGNDNGWIDPGDAIYTALLIWVDDNHDGISQPAELRTLAQAGVHSIAADSIAVDEPDQHGNVVKFRGRFLGSAGQLGLAVDVFFANQ